MSPKFFSKRNVLICGFVLTAVSLVLVGKFNLVGRAERENALLVPSISATKTATLQTDANGNGSVNPGDGLRYTVTIPNSGADPATGVTLVDTIDANTTLVGGSVIASPIAVNDTFSSIGNVGINVPAANGLLANDLDANNPGVNTALIITSAPTVSAQGGQVSVNSATGAFTYNPPPGFEGADSFSYTLANGTGLTDTATVNLTVSGMIWFINNTAAACTTIAAGCGRLSNPFSTLAAFQALNNGTGNNPAANDNIFIYESATGYAGGVTLLSGQKLIGQDATATLAIISGVSVPTFSNTLPLMNTGGNISAVQNSGGNAVTLNQGNTIRGLTVSGTSGTGIIGTAINNLTVGADVILTGITGTDFDLSGNGNGLISFGASITNTAGRSVSIQNRTGGTVDLTGAISDTGTGILLNSNTGATINFSGGLSLSTGANAAFTATGGGTVNATQNNTSIVNTLTTTTGTALNITNTNIGASGLTFRSVAKNGGTNSGIILNSTGSGPFTILGTGGAGSGGTIQNIVGADAVTLSTTGGLVTLNSIIIQDITASSDATDPLQTHSGVDAIHGRTVNGGLSLINRTIRRISDNAINGTVDAVPVTNSPTATTWNGLSITNSTFQNTNRFNVANRGDATNESAIIIWGIKGAVSVTGSTFQNCSSGIDFRTDTNGTLDMTVQSNVFNTLYKEIGTNSVGRFGISVVQLGSTTSTVRIGDWQNETNAALGNTFTNGGNVAGIQIVADTGATGNLKAEVAKNTLTVTDHSSPGQPPLNTIYNFPQSGVLYRNLGSGNFEGIFAANIFDQAMHANGGLGQLSLIAEKGDSEFIVRNNTFGLPWDLPMEIRADGQLGQNSCKVLITGNTHIDGIVGDGTTDLGGQSPYGSSFVQVRNNGRMDVTIQNEATPLGLTDTSSATGTASLFIQTTSAGDILNLFLQNIQGPRGYRLIQSAGTTFNLFRNGSAGPTAQTVLQDNANRGGGGVDTTNPPTVTATGTITLSNTAPMLPNITPSLASISESGANKLTGNLNLPFNSNQTHSEILAVLNPFDVNLPTRTKLTDNVPRSEMADVNTGVSEFFSTVADRTESSSIRTILGEFVDKVAESISPTVIAETTNAPFSGETINKSLGTIPAGESVTVRFDVTIDANIPTNDFSVSNQGTITGSNFANVLTDDPGVAGAANPTVTTVVQPPTIQKAFGAPFMTTNGTTTLTFTVGNANPATAFTNIAFSDTLPSGMVIATPNGLVNNCGGGTISATQNTNLFSVSALSRAANTTCTIVINVTASTEGAKNNVTSTIASAQGGTGQTASATVTVINAPTFTKAFGAPTIPLNSSTSLSFTITNNSPTSALNGVGFTDNLPTGLVVATPPNVTGSCGGGTITANAGATSISLAGAVLATSANCTFSVNVTGTTAGVKNNSVNLATTELGANSATANASLTVIAPPTITKSFAPSTVLRNNGFTVMTLAITNPAGNTVALNGVGVVDDFPSGMVVNITPTATNSCGTGTFSPSSGATGVTISGATIPINTTCNFTVRITGTSDGALLNTTQNVTSSNGGNGLTASATLNVTNTAVWNGATDSNWNTGTNWTPNLPPNAGNNVDIPSTGVTNNPTISASDATVGNLTVSSPRILTINAGRLLTVNNACTINGTMTVAGSFSCGSFSGTGTVNFTGTGAQNIPALTFNNLTINNASGVNLAGNVTVNGILTMTSGNITTGANVLTIGQTGTISRTAGQINGIVEKVFGATGAFNYPVGTATGFSPLAVNVTALTVNPSTLRVRANDGTAPAAPALDDALTLDRYWTLTETGDLTANLTFSYLQADVDGTETNYRTIRVTSGTATGLPNGSPCPGAGSPCVDATANTILVGNVSAFSDWTAGDFAPVAANVTVSGRVVTAEGRAVFNAEVKMVDQQGVERFARTNSFGFYRFTDVGVGESYVMSVKHKRYEFSSQVLTLEDARDDVHFIALP